jgi:hypothetical protein
MASAHRHLMTEDPRGGAIGSNSWDNNGSVTEIPIAC